MLFARGQVHRAILLLARVMSQETDKIEKTKRETLEDIHLIRKFY